MRKYVMLLAITIGVIAVGCSSMKVMVDYDDQFDFSHYKTFAFVPAKKLPKEKMKKPAVIKDPLFIKKASREISTVLTEMGYQKADKPGGADFLVAFYATAKNKAQITPPTYHIGRFGRRWVTPGRVYHYKQGTLIIDIVDRKGKELVWRGVGSGVLDRNDPRKNLLEAVQRVLSKFPPEN